MMKNIAVIYGGDSSEYQISIKSGKHVESIIDSQKYNVIPVLFRGIDWKIDDDSNTYISKEDFSFQKNGEKEMFSCAVIMIHGNPGENGILESYFDLLHIPYTTCSALVSAVTFNKHYCNTFLRNYNILMAKSYTQRKEDKIETSTIIENVGLPAFVKPAAGGSSFGITKVKKEEELIAAIQKAYLESDEVVIDEFIKGTEITCGLVKVNGEIKVLPLCEIISKKEFFDYEAKYTPSLSEEIVPARISEELTQKCKNISKDIYNLLNCRGIVRIDYILKGNGFYFLEVNTIPGMTAESIVPKMVKHENLDITKLYSDLIEEAISKAEKK
jgi:D-alanine-D-alanine ligase